MLHMHISKLFVLLFNTFDGGVPHLQATRVCKSSGIDPWKALVELTNHELEQISTLVETTRRYGHVKYPDAITSGTSVKRKLHTILQLAFLDRLSRAIQVAVMHIVMKTSVLAF